MINVLSLFSGIGAFESALKRLNIDFKILNYCEIDKYASLAYSKLHHINESYNLWDVKKVTGLLLSDVDLITYGFPCQDISISGQQKGFIDTSGNRTRSGLFFEALRIIEEVKPKYAIAENVKALTSKKFKKELDIVLSSLEEVGYKNFYKVLNSCDFGIPQNRERLFIISIRKDLKQDFVFPKKNELLKSVEDILEKNVPEKYQIKSKYTDKFINDFINSDKEKKLKHKKIIQIGNIAPKEGNFKNPQCYRIYHTSGLAPTLNTCQGGGRVPKFLFKDSLHDKTAYMIRQLTPLECFKLMGFTESDFNKIKGSFSNTRLYKMAGNSIVINVLEAIFKELF